MLGSRAGWTRAMGAVTAGIAIASMAMGCGGDPESSADSGPDAPAASESTRGEPAKVHVPHVTGLSVDQAAKRLRVRGLSVGTVERRPSAKPRGTVLSQVRSGSSISLVIAAPFPVVPDTVGDNSAAARRVLRRAGFEVVKTRRRTDSATPGSVIDQSPNGDTRARPGATVTITIARKPPAPPPPSTQESDCASGYSPCLPPASDYDCAGGSGDGPAYAEGPISVTGSDPYDLDSDSDGVACED
jgi:resuscitation-promoting factor RpfB